MVKCLHVHPGSSSLNAALVRVGYSIWTNTNYKNPLIASAVACLLGNVCYCLSYDLGAVWLLFLARLITGFGEFTFSSLTSTSRSEVHRVKTLTLASQILHVSYYIVKG